LVAEVNLTEKSLSKLQMPALYYEYTQAANPHLPPVPCRVYPSALHQSKGSGLTVFGCEDILETPYPATSPNVLAHYLHIESGSTDMTNSQAGAQLFYVIRGEGHTDTPWGRIHWKERDVLMLPYAEVFTHHALMDSALYWVHDGPLYQYLGATPLTNRFQPAYYPWETIQAKLDFYNQQEGALNRNRNAVILGSADCQKTMSASPTLWATIVSVEPGVVQKPHRHNSVAVDMVIQAEGEVYTLVGKALDSEKQIVNPQKVQWEAGAAFITPPALWHGHYNESDKPAIIMAVQDASIHEWMRTLDIQFT
jgi:gentisate 1,2-dioxygenase